MSIKWIKMEDRKPEDEQDCLTKMKHGMIQGRYDAEDESFKGYYWRDMEWSARAWIPIEEVE